MYLAGNLRIEQLLTNQMQIDEIVVRHANVHMVRQVDGQWNTSALLPLPHFSDQSSNITIEAATATLANAATPEAKPWILQGVNLKLAPLPIAADRPNAPKHFHIEGVANGPPARELRIDGELGTADGVLDVAVTASGLDISPETLAYLPASVTARLDGAQVSGQADVTLRLNRPDSTTPLSWAANFSVERGRFNHPLLTEALTDVTLKGLADPQRLSIERFEAKSGPASITLAMNRAGWTANAPLALSAKVVGFVLTDRLQTTLPESQARIWQRFRPNGPVDVDLSLTFNGQNWTPTFTADCRGISLTDMEKFPYVLEQTSGKVTYLPAKDGNPDQLRLDLTGIGGGRPVKVDAQLTHLAPVEPHGLSTGEGVADEAPFDASDVYAAGYRGLRYARADRSPPTHPLGYVELSGSDIPLHEALIAALPPKAKVLVSDLNAQGAIDFHFRAEWKDLAQQNAATTLDIPLKDCRIKFAQFPLPLQHLQGTVKGEKSPTEETWHWTLNDIEARGSSDSTVVKCRGIALSHDAGCGADLTFVAQNVPLDESLKAALPPAGQQAWNDLRPQGSIDFTAHATKLQNEPHPNVEIALRPCESTVSIKPRLFPYRLDEVQGVATYKRGQAVWHNVIARHDRSVYSMESGTWQLATDGGWQCTFANVNIDRLVPNAELLEALPPALQSVIAKLQPSGTIDLRKGSLNFAKPAQSVGIAAAWDVSLECQQAAIQGAVPIQGINGGIRIVGRSDGRSTYNAGELALDSILYKNVQLTNVRGPFWADSAHCLLGESACLQQSQPPRRLTADAYGGSLNSNIELALGPIPGYRVDVHLGAVNLARFANERLGGQNNLNGTLSGTLAVSNTGTSLQTLIGTGELHLVDANIYQVPLLVSMLSVLRNRTPDTTAFNRCDMKFGIQGEHILFDKLDLMGDAVSLYGNGQVDFNRRLDLVFYTLVGPADLPIPLWKTIAGHVSKQGLQLKVVGTFEDPKVEKKALPAVNDMLGQLQTELHDSAATISPSAAVRGSHPAAK